MDTIKVSFMYEGSTHEITIREDSDYKKTPWKYNRKNARAFVWSSKVEVDESILENKAAELGLDTIHTQKGDSKEMDKAWRAFNKLERELQERLLTVGLEAAGYKNVGMKFSRHAGCSCPCSPGFILTPVHANGPYYYHNVYISEVKVIPNRALIMED